MYKSRFHKGTCDVCSKVTDVITIGLLDNEKHNKDYCVKCSEKWRGGTLINYVRMLAHYFRVPISVEDLVLYYDFYDLEKCITSYAVRDDDFVVMVNKMIEKFDEVKYSNRTRYQRSLYIRLSKIHGINFFNMNPYKFRLYELARKEILDDTHISCSHQISDEEYNILIHSMNELYPLPK